MNTLSIDAGTILIDRYQIDGYLNAGAMQRVYECTDLKLRRKAVVKVPKAGVRDRRFRRGAEMSASINHHNVAATFDYYEDSQGTFMVEELVDGVDLGRRLSSEFEHLDPSLAAHVLHNILRALHEAHRVNICHRDLKPSNIMTSRDPAMSVIKLTDFGIAKLAENEIAAEMADFERDESTLTTSSTLLGAVPYLAPECWSNWRGVGTPGDIWALGCIAYQLVTGVLPFGTGRSAIMAMARLEQGAEVNLARPALFGRSAANAGIENDLWALITSCLQVDPAQRPDAETLLRESGGWCYATPERRTGVIASFGVSYAAGGRSETGSIEDVETGEAYFYHVSEFYGAGRPARGQRVNVGVYPGFPRRRAAPVLLLRQPRP